MNTARIVVLTIALGAGGVAAYLARGTDDKAQAPAQPIAQLPTVEVLVAKNEIGLGQSVKPDDLQWQTWPAAAARGSIIKRGDRPDASKQIAGMIARAPFIAGEPIRGPKLATADGSGSHAAIRPTGMHALARRSIGDIIAENNTEEDAAPKKGVSINVVRYGVQSSTTTQK